jgi:hypothetical protein
MTPEQAISHLERLLEKLPVEIQHWLLDALERLLESDWLDAETWAGIGILST